VNQQVNLYLPEFRPSREWLNASRLLWLVLAAVLVMALVSGYDYWRLTGLRDEQAMLQDRLATQARETGELERQVASRTGDERLQRELEARQARLQRTRGLLGFLEDARLGNTDGFSSVMKDLSRASFEGLWLTEFQLQQGGESVTLSGVVRQSAMVPDFIGRLGNGESTLREQQFHRLSGTRKTASGDDEPPSQGAGYEFVLEAR
jgi:Tfp pilus assembly protein PilN